MVTLTPPKVLIPETWRFVAVINPTVVIPEALTLSWFKVPTDVNEELITPVPKVVELRTEVLLIL